MTHRRPHVLDDFAWRGLIAVSTDLAALRAAMDAGPVTVYCGFDPTAPSLHLGNLVQILVLRRLQDAGHRPLALVGGATGLIGDPKENAERKLNDPEVVAGWVERIKSQVEPFLDFDGRRAAHAGGDGRTTSTGRRSSPRSICCATSASTSGSTACWRKTPSARGSNSDAGISYTEFSYQILQGMDFLELYRRYGCTLQTGGSDQWGNLTAGLDLIHRVSRALSAHALATPLITKADGTKFGKTESGTVWLDPTMTSPYAFYQFWINADDARRGRATSRSSACGRAHEIEELEAAVAERPAARAAQRALAEEMTTLVHGAAECAKRDARQCGAVRPRRAGRPRRADARRRAGGDRRRHRRREPRPVVDVLVETGLVDSRSAARRAIAEGGAYLNNVKVTDPDRALSTGRPAARASGSSCAAANGRSRGVCRRRRLTLAARRFDPRLGAS